MYGRAGEGKSKTTEFEFGTAGHGKVSAGVSTERNSIFHLKARDLSAAFSLQACWPKNTCVVEQFQSGLLGAVGLVY